MDPPALELDRVVVLDNATHLDVRERKGLSIVFRATVLEDGLVHNVAFKIRDRPIRMDRSRSYGLDFFKLPRERNFNVRVFAACLGEYLDSKIVVLVTAR